MTTVLTRRVLPGQATQVRDGLAQISQRLTNKGPLALGAQGNAVKALQSHLKAAGLYAGKVSGTFDEATRDALVAFQTARKLPATGELNRATLKKLREVNLFVKDGFSTVAKAGQRGSDIAKVERQLAALGFLKADKVDGVFDGATARAVLRYRKADKQLGDKGEVIGAGFAKELNKARADFKYDRFRNRDVGTKAEQQQHAKLDERVMARAKAPGGLALGAKGPAVKQLERHLQAAGFDVGGANETFNLRTEAAVRAYQTAKGLKVTGAVNAQTWKALRGELFAATGGTAPAQRVGEQSGAVLRTEKLLKKLGYKVAADGRFTEQTRKAVLRFQDRHGLKETGQVGTGTLNKIQQVVKQKSAGRFESALLDLARSQLGVRETPMGSNVQKYSKYFGRPPEPWCADFVSWLYTETSKKLGVNRKLNEPWTVALLAKLKANGSFNRNHPKPGDIIIYDWSPSQTADPADHTGVVEKVFKKNGRWYVQTIEGNWGNKVARKVVPLSSSTIRGFGTIR